MEDKRTWDTVEKPFLITIFGSALDSPLHPSTPLWQFCDPKWTHFHPFCLDLNFVWGGRKEVASFTDTTWKVPTLLTLTVGFSFSCGKPHFCLCNHHVEFQKSWGVGKNQKKQRRGGGGGGEGDRLRNIRQQNVLDSSLCYIEKETPNK